MDSSNTDVKPARIGAAPSFGYTLLLVLSFGAALLASHYLAPIFMRSARSVLECDVPRAGDTVAVITVDVRGSKVIASCVHVVSRGAYGRDR